MIREDRRVNFLYDVLPSLHHRFEARITQKIVKGKTVLDIGCWTGQWLSCISKGAKQVWGIDPNEQAVKYAKTRKIGNFVVGSALSLPFDNHKFQVVTMWDVIEHLPKNSELLALKEVWRVLSPKGIFCLSTVTDNLLCVLGDPAWWFLGHRHYSEAKIRDFLVKSGFEIKDIVYSGGIWTFVADILSLIRKHFLGQRGEILFLKDKVESEHRGKGWIQIHVMAQKNES